MDHTVCLRGVRKSFGKQVILKDIDFTSNAGQIYGLIGPSGAGKMTVVKMIVGMDAADEGTVYLLNKKMLNLEILRNIGYMAQSDALYTALTGKENLQFFASLYKLSKTERAERIAYTANLVNLT